MLTLKGKVVVITGGTEGLGNALALSLISVKAKVWILSRNSKQNDYSDFNFLNCDLNSESEIVESLKKIVSKEGKLDILINNAGIWSEGEISKYSLEEIRNVLNVNTAGLIRVTAEATKYLVKSNFSQILNVISTSGLYGNANWSVYSGSKYAVRGFSESIALELKEKGVRVMSIYPAGINTDFYANAGLDIKKGQEWMLETSIVVNSIIFMLTIPVGATINHLELNKF